MTKILGFGQRNSLVAALAILAGLACSPCGQPP